MDIKVAQAFIELAIHNGKLELVINPNEENEVRHTAKESPAIIELIAEDLKNTKIKKVYPSSNQYFISYDIIMEDGSKLVYEIKPEFGVVRITLKMIKLKEL